MTFRIVFFRDLTEYIDEIAAFSRLAKMTLDAFLVTPADAEFNPGEFVDWHVAGTGEVSAPIELDMVQPGEGLYLHAFNSVAAVGETGDAITIASPAGTENITITLVDPALCDADNDGVVHWRKLMARKLSRAPPKEKAAELMSAAQGFPSIRPIAPPAPTQEINHEEPLSYPKTSGTS